VRKKHPDYSIRSLGKGKMEQGKTWNGMLPVLGGGKKAVTDILMGKDGRPHLKRGREPNTTKKSIGRIIPVSEWGTPAHP